MNDKSLNYSRIAGFSLMLASAVATVALISALVTLVTGGAS